MRAIELLKMFCSDADGCLNGPEELGAPCGPTVPWDLVGMKLLKDELSRVKDKAPDWIFSVITGRSDDWLLALIEALGIAKFWPDVYVGAENGAIARRLGEWGRIALHPEMNIEVMESLGIIDREIIPKLVKFGGVVEPKSTCRTVTAPAGMSSVEFADVAKKIMEGCDSTPPEIKIIFGASAVDFVRVNKEAGIRHIASLNGINLDDICVAGDGGADLDMARIAGNSGAPANASEKVKAGMKMVAKSPGPRGVIEIIRAVIFEDQSGILNK